MRTHTYIGKPAGLIMFSTLLIGPGLAQTTGAEDAWSEYSNSTSPLSFAQYERYDSNRDGRISLPEFTAGKQDERAFREADANQDGWLDQEEYIKAISISGRMAVGDYLGDRWITTRIKSLLLADNVLNGLKIDVDTQGRVVELSGQLSNSAQISRAIEIARRVDGVQVIHNGLQLAH